MIFASVARHPARCMIMALTLAVSACPSRREGLSRDALDRASAVVDGQEALPSIGALLALRIPPPGPMPPSLRGTPAELAFARGEPIPGDAVDAEAELLRCLRADARREYDAIVTHCARFVARCGDEACTGTAPPADLRAAVVTMVLARHVGSVDDDTRRGLVPVAEGSIERCRANRGVGTCVPQVVAARQLLQNVADGVADEATRLRLRASDATWLAEAEVDGPWLDGERHFSPTASMTSTTSVASTTLAHGRPMLRHPRFRSRHLDGRDGRLRPASDAVPGWYRVTVHGEAAGGPATIVLSGHGAVEVRVDGTPVLVRHSGDGGPAIELVPVDLAAGGHDLEVLFFDRGPGLALAVLDDDGRPALKTGGERRWRRPAGATLRRGADLKAIGLPPTIASDDATALPLLMVRQLGARFGLGLDQAELQTTTARLLEHFGWSAPGATAAALGIEADDLPDQVRRAQSLPVWGLVEAAWPDAPLPILARARAAADDEPEAALAAYRELVTRSPRYPIGWREFIDALLDRGLVDEALDAAEVLLRFGHTAENIDAATPAFRAAGALVMAATLSEERLRRSAPAVRDRRRLQQGETDAVLGDLTRSQKAEDDDVFSPALDLLEVHRPDLAGAFYERRTAERPDDTGLALRAVRHAGDAARAQALASTTASLPVTLLATHLGATPPWAHALAEGDAVVAARLGGAPPVPAAGAVTLLQSTERHFAADGSSITVRHSILEVRSKDSIDAIGELQRSDDDVFIRLRVVKPDGRELEPEHHAEVKDISLTGLAPGDLVEWVVIGADDGARDGAFWETVSMTSSTSTLLRRYVATWPASLEANRTVVGVSTNGAPPGVRSRRGERVELRFEVRDIPPLLDEPHAGPRIDDEPQVGIQLDVDDDTLIAMRTEQVRQAMARDPWVDAVAVQIAGRGPARERLQRLFRFVSTRVVEAPAPAEATATLATGRGQRLSLLWALARGAGLDARTFAVHGVLDPSLRLPHGRAWTTVVIGVAVDDAPAGAIPPRMFVAAFDEALLLDHLPPSFRGAAILDLDDGARGTMPDSAIDDAPVEVITDLTLHLDDAGDGRANLRGLAVVRLPAPLAEPLRPTVRGATPEQLERFVESVFAGTLPGVAASHVSTPGLDAVGASLALVADIVVPIDMTGPVRFEHLFAGGASSTMRAAPPLASYARVSQRQRTLSVAPHRERVEMTWRLPPTVSVVELPVALDLRAGPFRLTQQASVDDGVVRWERQIEAGLALVKAPEWPDVRAALAPLMTASDARLIFVVARPADGR